MNVNLFTFFIGFNFPVKGCKLKASVIDSTYVNTENSARPFAVISGAFC